MKQTIQLKLGQQLTITPQLQQAIRLLQLSTLELQSEIQQALESNPMLEIDETNPSAENHDNNASSDQQIDRNGVDNSESSAGDADNSLDSGQDSDSLSIDLGNEGTIPDDLPVDSAWEDIYDIPVSSHGSGTDDDDARNYLENQSGQEDVLFDHLQWQLHLTPMSDVDQAIAMAIIDAINDDGYLTETLEQIHAGLTDEFEIDLDEVQAVLRRIQQFDPPGIAARNLRECLLLQMRLFSEDTPGFKPARLIVEKYLDLLGNHDYAGLKRHTRLKEDELKAAITFIQSLNPRPGAQISTNTSQYIVPDVFVSKQKGCWRVELNPETAPRIRINPVYAGYVRNRERSPDNTYLKNNLQEARWFLKSLQSRNETLLKVATCIVEKQRTFLEYGEEGMKPLVLREIAEELGLHESTVSRVTTQKYMHTPRGIYEFKYFFSSHVGTSDGGECSSTAIRAMIKKLIENEEPRKPLSDNKIAAILKDKGINVARRTVAKYREAMSIPPSNERKRLT